MRPFIASPEDRERLNAEALSWLATPYAAAGDAIKGAGCSCSHLPYAVLHACGHTTPAPPDRGGLPKSKTLARIRDWLNREAAHFAPIHPTEVDVGDIVLIDAGMGHLLLVVDDDNLIHCWANGGVQMVNRRDPAVTKRIAGAWRPILS